MTNKREIIQSEITESICKSNFNGIIHCSPRMGKTKSIIDALNRITKEVKIVVTAPYNNILTTWTEECEKWSCKHQIETVNFRSIQTITDKDIILVIDECQELSEAQIKYIQTLKPVYIIMASGTIGEKSMKKLSVLKRKIIYEYNIEQAIDDKIVNDYQVILHPIRLDDSENYIQAGNKAKYWLTTEYKHYQYLTKVYNSFKYMNKDAYVNIPVKMQMAIKRANAIYTYKSKIETVKRFIKGMENYILFTARTEVCNEFGNPYHSNIEKSDEDNLVKFKNQEISNVSVVNMASMGISFPYCNTVVVHQFNSDEELAIQKIMRACMIEGKTEKTMVHIFYYSMTKDEEWLTNALKGLNKDKIKIN